MLNWIFGIGIKLCSVNLMVILMIVDFVSGVLKYWFVLNVLVSFLVI